MGQALETFRHRAHNASARQHADLDRPHVEILDHRLDLGRDDLGRGDVDGAHAERVLRGQRRDRAGAIDAERGEGLEVGLNAGAAAESEPAMVSAIRVRVIARRGSSRSIRPSALPDWR